MYESRCLGSSPEGALAAIRTQLLKALNKPQPVRRVEIPKALRHTAARHPRCSTASSAGGLQVLQAEWDDVLEHNSASAEASALSGARAQELIASGHDIVVDIDLEKFFDRSTTTS